MDEIRDLSCRLEKLEAQNRRLRKVFILLLIAAGALVMMGQLRNPLRGLEGVAQAPPPIDYGKLRAQAFILTDDRGHERASLVTDGSGSVFLVMFDKDGKPRADLQVSNYGPSINFYDPNAKTRLVIGSTTLVGSHVAKDGIVEKNPPSSIVMFDSSGGLLWRTP